MLSENCCSVVCRPSRGRVICLLFSSPPRGICQRQFSIYPPKKCLSPGLVWGGMDANLKCTAPLKANRSEWSWFAVRKYMINFVECARPSRIIFLKKRVQEMFWKFSNSTRLFRVYQYFTKFTRGRAICYTKMTYICVLNMKSFCFNSKKAKTCLPSQCPHSSTQFALFSFRNRTFDF